MDHALDIRVLAIVLAVVLIVQMLALACWLVGKGCGRAFATARRSREAREPQRPPVQAEPMV
ncbi:hypothetical protein [Agrococcus jenensis]|uniref:Uncharacterized protein n=1 Tax=Agrococcus jenensis TaxID=46353 RepID=A0A3N2AWB6_9MICO|nr:hypothetical protein [Agrococcus jenensis]ROR67062.1 hypothetical protein EDD26_2461 [Agrococcus jenensis]